MKPTAPSRLIWSAFFGLLIQSVAACAEPALVAEARQAFREAIPMVAALKAERFLSLKPASVEESDGATLLLVEALAELRQPEEALTHLRPLLEKGVPGAALWRARLLFAQRKWKDAQTAFHLLNAAPGAPVEALLGEAEALHALDRLGEAATLLATALRSGADSPALRLRLAAMQAENREAGAAEATLAQVTPRTPEEEKWKSYIEGRLLLLRDQAAPALTTFESIVATREHLPESLFAAAVYGATDARIALYGSEEADSVLETFIWRHPDSPFLPRVFRRLDQIYAQEENPPETEFLRWIQKPQAPRAAFARFYLAKEQMRAGKTERALATISRFLEQNGEHSLMGEAFLLQADAYSQLGNFAEAARALDGAMRGTSDSESRAQIELRQGLIQYQQGEFLLAATQFDAAAERAPSVRPIATFDAALCWLAERNFDKFRTELQGFSALQPGSPLHPDLLLEEGMAQARQGAPEARASLERFLRLFPQNARGAEARLALAELVLFPSDGRVASAVERSEAARSLRLVSAAAPPAEISAQAEYLGIWLNDTQEPRDPAETIRLARAFLKKHPASEWVPAVRMKLGQLFFNREDYASAETYFTQLVQEAPASPLVETALFLGGQAAAKLMNPGAVDRALAFFDAVVGRQGPLRLYARQEQANIQSRLAHENQAIALLDLIVSATPPADPQLRQASACGKGDNLLSLGRRQNAPDLINQAVTVYDELAHQPDVTPVWRNQALFKEGKALEQLGRQPEALVAYYDVLNRSMAADREYFWLYKAGFDAAHLLEQQEQWKAAVSIYEKMAAFDGPRSAEARDRLRQLRLDRFLWE